MRAHARIARKVGDVDDHPHVDGRGNRVHAVTERFGRLKNEALSNGPVLLPRAHVGAFERQPVGHIKRQVVRAGYERERAVVVFGSLPRLLRAGLFEQPLLHVRTVLKTALFDSERFS